MTLRQTAKMSRKLLPSVFSCLYSRVKAFLFAMPMIVRDICPFLCDLFKDYKKRIKKSEVLFAVCRLP